MESQKIKQLLNEKSISQKEFAEKIGVHPITLNRCLKENKFSKKIQSKIISGFTNFGITCENILEEKRKNSKVVIVEGDAYGILEWNGHLVKIINNESLYAFCEKVKRIEELSKSLHPTKEYVYFKTGICSNEYNSTITIFDYGKTKDFLSAEELFIFYEFKCADYLGFENKKREEEFDFLLDKFIDNQDIKALRKARRKLKVTDEQKWEKGRERIMYRVLKDKFNCNEDFREVLLSPQFHGKTFVQVGNDKIWGIGIGLKDAFEGKEWKGNNLLGKALTQLRDEELKEKINFMKDVKITEEFVYFYNGIFSNWYPLPADYEGIRFLSSEHLFMYLKAKFFNDEQIAEKIIQARTYRTAKNLGKKVSGFDEESWKQVREDMMYNALKAKFDTNEDFRQALLSKEFRGKTFVEASKYDSIWGIGISVKDAFKGKEWKGNNLLGKALTKLRDEELKELK